MKSTISKILGVAVTLSIIASMMITGTASAAVGTLGYGVVNTPSKVGQVLVPGVQIDFFAVSADGKTVFAYDDTAGKIYKSTDGGVSFGTPVSVGTGDAVGIALSPNFATDNTVVLAETLKVYYSTGGGATGSWVDVSPDALAAQLGAGGAVTSLDVGPYFADNVLSILVGCTGAANNVLKFKFGFFAWEAVGAITTPVYAVAFSENHMSDAEIVAVTDNAAGDIVLTRKVGTLAWNYSTYPDKTILAAVNITSAVIAMPAGTSPSSGLLVGLGDGATANDGVYYVAASASKKLAGDVYSISIGASIAEVYVGLADGTVTKSVNVNSTSATFTNATKPPTGATNAYIVASGSKVYATKMGAEGAFAVSTDGGTSFNEISLINAAVGILSLYDIVVVDNNTMFLAMKNTAGSMYIFKTTDAAATWMRVQAVTAANLLIAVSPAYATDQTLAYSDGTAVVRKIDQWRYELCQHRNTQRSRYSDCGRDRRKRLCWRYQWFLQGRTLD